MTGLQLAIETFGGLDIFCWTFLGGKVLVETFWGFYAGRDGQVRLVRTSRSPIYLDTSPSLELVS